MSRDPTALQPASPLPQPLVLPQRAILLFWAPLAAQWLMMGLEGPFLAAVIARLVDPTVNLAAYGVAFAFALLAESPVIMLLSASTALVEDAHSYRKLRNFTNLLNVGCTLLVLLVVAPPVFTFLMDTVLHLPPAVAATVRGSIWLLLPWPAAIGYRRFVQGVLIRAGKTRLIAYGTAVRLVGMAGAALFTAFVLRLPGAWVGAFALSTGVIVEAVAVRAMGHGTIRELLRAPALTGGRTPPAATEFASEGGAGAEEIAGASIASRVSRPEATSPAALLGYREITRFYYPLALTSLLSLTVQPILTFFMGRAALPIESLAVFPVVHSLSFLFRGPAISLQEAAIALIGPRFEHARELRRFGTTLALASSGALAVLAFTPLAMVWFSGVSGLQPALADIAVTPTRIGVLLPGLTALLSFQQAVLVQGRTTRAITLATALEVGVIALLFVLFGARLGLVGVTAAMLALVGGRLAANAWLLRPVARTLSARAR